MSPPSPRPLITADKPSPPSLNHDIYLIIIPLLARRDLIACCRVSKSIQSIATPHLYAKVQVDLSSKRSTPDFAKGSPADQVAGLSRGLKAINLRQDVHTLAELPSPGRFTYTTHLTITCHTRDMCHGLPSPVLPNLITLRIKGGFDLCLPNPTSSRKWREKALTTLCPFVAHLRPRRIVLGGPLSGLTGTCCGLSTASHAFPASYVEELVVLVGAMSGLDNNATAPSFLPDLPGTVGRIILIVQPETPEGSALVDKMMGAGAEEDMRWESHHRREALAQERRDTHAYLLTEGLARACHGQAKSMTIMGLETVDIDRTGSSLEDKAALLRKTLARQLVGELGWDADAARKRAESLRFVRIDESQGEEL